MFDGTLHVLLLVLSRGKIAGPFCPLAPMWILAAVPSTPEVVTLPNIDRSLRTLTVPLPVAAVVTGGTSWLPLRVTFEPLGAELWAHATATSTAAPRPFHQRVHPTIRRSVCMYHLPRSVGCQMTPPYSR